MKIGCQSMLDIMLLLIVNKTKIRTNRNYLPYVSLFFYETTMREKEFATLLPDE